MGENQLKGGFHGLSPDVIAAGISTFTGAGRRMEFKGVLKDCAVRVPVYDDFGHHPSEVDGCDEVFFADIYAARETNTYGVTSEQLADRIAHASYTPDWDALKTYLCDTALDGDLLIIMGAGDIAKFAEAIAKPE